MLAELMGANWIAIRDGDPRALGLFARHYSAKKNGKWRGVSRRRSHDGGRIVGPGERIVLLTADSSALFVWRKERYRDDGQKGVNCAVFRNEGGVLSSLLIQEADQLAWQEWPGERHFTYVDPREIRSTNPGYCFLQAGWTRLEERSKTRGLVILEVFPSERF
jgi:hypothetical protein